MRPLGLISARIYANLLWTSLSHHYLYAFKWSIRTQRSCMRTSKPLECCKALAVQLLLPLPSHVGGDLERNFTTKFGQGTDGLIHASRVRLRLLPWHINNKQFRGSVIQQTFYSITCLRGFTNVSRQRKKTKPQRDP